MEVNFDKRVNRIGTDSAKWDIPYAKYGARMIPLSVADMDIPAPEPVINALNERNRTGIYGYTVISEDYYKIVADYLERHYHYPTETQNILFCPRIIQAVSIYLREFTAEGDAVCLFTPSYSPIANAVTLNNRTLIDCPLIYENQTYRIDFKRLEECFKRVKTFILISPHNPTGLVFGTRELQEIALLAERYRVFIISDDIHADFNFSGQRHRIISALNDYVKAHSIICTSPSKTFNVAGLEVSNLIIHNQAVRDKFKRIMQQLGMHNPNYFSVPAVKAAYCGCDDWLAELQRYIAENKRLTKDFLQQHIPALEVVDSAGTYLVWVNYTRLGISEAALKHWMLDLAGVEMSWGSDFGKDGAGFFRMNVAVPRSFLMDCLNKIKQGFISFEKEEFSYAK